MKLSVAAINKFANTDNSKKMAKFSLKVVLRVAARAILGCSK